MDFDIQILKDFRFPVVLCALLAGINGFVGIHQVGKASGSANFELRSGYWFLSVVLAFISVVCFVYALAAIFLSIIKCFARRKATAHQRFEDGPRLTN